MSTFSSTCCAFHLHVERWGQDERTPPHPQGETVSSRLGQVAQGLRTCQASKATRVRISGTHGTARWAGKSLQFQSQKETGTPSTCWLAKTATYQCALGVIESPCFSEQGGRLMESTSGSHRQHLCTFKNKNKQPTCIHTNSGKTHLMAGDLCPRLTLDGCVPVLVQPHKIENREGPEPGKKEKEDQKGAGKAWVKRKEDWALSCSQSKQSTLPSTPAEQPCGLLWPFPGAWSPQW